MTPEDRPRFVELISGMTRTFGREADEATFTGYEMGLGDLTIEAIEEAVMTAMRSHDHLPTVRALRRLTGELSAADRAIIAWGAFEKAVVEQGGYTSVKFDDPVIHATVRNHGGWPRCCQLPASEFDKWLRQDFVKTYTALCSTGISAEAGQPLIGEHDSSNAMNGYHKHVKRPLAIATGLPPHANLRRLGGPSTRPTMGTSQLTAEIGKENP